MKQENAEKLAKSKEVLAELKVMRGGAVMDYQKKMANDPKLIQMFLDSYNGYAKEPVIPEKYREIILMVIGMVSKTDITTLSHAKKAVYLGATVDEICDAVRIVFMMCGLSSLLPALEVLGLEPIDFE